MKTILVSTLLLFTSTLFAADISAVRSGNWSTPNTWDLSRAPANGDVIYIPAGFTVTVSTVQNYNLSSLSIHIYGVMDLLSPGKIDITESGVIFVYRGGKISGSGSPSESIKIGGVKKFNGTQPDVAGPKMASSSTGNGFMSFGVLPVHFTMFQVIRSGQDFLVSWSASPAETGSYFAVERSENGVQWFAVAQVYAQGTTSSHHYQYTDKQVQLASVHYRIRHRNTEGRVVYSPVQSLKVMAAPVTVHAMKNKVRIRLDGALQGTVGIHLVSATGRTVVQQSRVAANGLIEVETPSLTGNYFVTILHQDRVVTTQQLHF